MSTTTNTNAATCPECAANVAFTRPPLQGEVIRCRECTAELEVTGTAPIQLTLAPQVEEDWGE
jgi:alpha-aminoadipate carrier protein LysW